MSTDLPQGPDAPEKAQPVSPVTDKEFAELYGYHLQWLRSKGGEGLQLNLAHRALERMDLRFQLLAKANLEGVSFKDSNLEGVNFSGSNLKGADFDGALLKEARFEQAVLTDAKFSNADLSDADQILTKLLAKLPREERRALHTAFTSGQIDGISYSGENACLFGTLARIRGMDWQDLQGLGVDAASPLEQLLTGIRAGDTPETNPLSAWVIARFKKE